MENGRSRNGEGSWMSSSYFFATAPFAFLPDCLFFAEAMRPDDELRPAGDLELAESVDFMLPRKRLRLGLDPVSSSYCCLRSLEGESVGGSWPLRLN